MGSTQTPGRNEIGYRSYNRIRNVGDAFTPYVLKHLTGLRPAAVSHDVPHLLAVGSIYFMANEHSYLWGTGVMNPATHFPPIPADRIFALRGRKSVEVLHARGVAVGDVPLGDPGIFAAEIMASKNASREIRYRAAIIPHHGSFAHPFYHRVRDSKEFVLAEVMDNTLRSLDLIVQSEIVLSQSLHGLIFAESLGKPAVWVANQDNANWNFKFEDWFSTTSNPQARPVALSMDIEAILARAERSFSTIDKKALAAALPIDPVTYDLETPLEFERCRGMEPVTVSIPSLFGGLIFRSSAELSERLPNASYHAFDWSFRFFSKWSERTYLCLQPDDEEVPVTHSQLRWICVMMDRDLQPDCAYILSRQSLAGRDVRLVETGNGVAVVEGATHLGGALLLRPQFGGLTERFITFAV